MNRSPSRDLIVGLFVLVGLGAIAYLSVKIGGASYSGPGGLIVHAYFDEVGDLTPRAPVVIGGVRVGRVESVKLEPKEFRAHVVLDLDRSLQLPDDTSASIVTRGVLGDKLVALDPGGSDESIANGGEIVYTHNAVVLERLIGRVMTGLGGDEN